MAHTTDQSKCEPYINKKSKVIISQEDTMRQQAIERLDPPEVKIYGTCEICKEEIYVGDTIYSSCDLEVCENCTYEFLREYRRVAE